MLMDTFKSNRMWRGGTSDGGRSICLSDINEESYFVTDVNEIIHYRHAVVLILYPNVHVIHS